MASAHRLLAVEHETDGLGDEIVVAGHAPGHSGLSTLRPLGRARPCERLHEIDVDLHELERAALGARHLPLA